MISSLVYPSLTVGQDTGSVLSLNIPSIASEEAPANSAYRREPGGPMRHFKNTVIVRPVLMIDAENGILGRTGESLTVTFKKHNGAYVPVSPTVVERGEGVYDLIFALAASDTLGSWCVHVEGDNSYPADYFDEITEAVANVSIENPSGFKKNTAVPNFKFSMLDLLGLPYAGATVVARRALDNGSLALCANAPVAIGGGDFTINFAASDFNGDIIFLEFTGVGARRITRTILTEP